LKSVYERRGNSSDLVGRFVHELQTVMCDSRIAPRLEMLASLLGFGAKHGVTATDIGHDRMFAPIRVSQSDAMLLTRASAVLIAGSRGKKSAEDAVLGVKHRQVLICDDFEFV
jgi:hypothetical protein